MKDYGLRQKPKCEQKPSSVLLKSCANCGKKFMAKNNRYNYCPECYRKNNPSFSKPKEPKRCVVCGCEFIPKTKHSKLCGKKECDRTFSRQKAQQVIAEKNRLMFSKGMVWLLDMEKWRWIQEERGQKND
jgi:hypothetical protein